MALNFPGPYEVRLFYTVTGTSAVIQHEARYNIRVDPEPAPGDPFSSISVLRRDDSPFDLDGEIDDWVVMMKALFTNQGTATTIDFAELWKYEDESFDAEFVSTYPIAVAGTSATATSASGQVIVTFRTTNGGVMKLSFMETVISPGVVDTLPFANAALDTIADEVVAGTVPWMGRDNGYPFACIAAYPGQNEATFKRRNRM